MIRKAFSVWIAFMLAVAVSGCATFQQGKSSPVQLVETSCAAVSAAVDVLAVAEQNGQVNAPTEKSVDSLIAITRPVCNAPSPPTLSDAELTAFNGAVSQLANYAATYRSVKR